MRVATALVTAAAPSLSSLPPLLPPPPQAASAASKCTAPGRGWPCSRRRPRPASRAPGHDQIRRRHPRSAGRGQLLPRPGVCTATATGAGPERPRLCFEPRRHGQPPSDYSGPRGELLQQLPSTALVIITHLGNTGKFSPESLSSLNNALGNGALAAKWTFPAGGCWSGAANACSNPPNSYNRVSWPRGALNGGLFTVIGVPASRWGRRGGRRPTRQAPAGVLPATHAGTATTGGTDYYTVINGGPDAYAPVDTCAGTSCAVRIGINITGTVSAGSTKITSVTPSTGYSFTPATARER